MEPRTVSKSESAPSAAKPALPASFVAAVWVAAAALCGFQYWWSQSLTAALEEQAQLSRDLMAAHASLEETGAELERAAVEVGSIGMRLDAMNERLEAVAVVADEWEFLVQDVQKLITFVGELKGAVEMSMGENLDSGPPQPPPLDWTEPALYEAARKGAETVGVTLGNDEVRIPAKLVMREGLLEYFAVLKGGKEHEALVGLVGNTPADERRPPEFAAKLNNAIQALGFTRGRPIRLTARGTSPAEGEPIYLFVEWEADGETHLARAEDLIWNRVENRPMQRGRWVYVGSSFVEDEPGSVVFAADLTAEFAATYSSMTTIVDNITAGAADDTVFIAATPRIPEITDITLVVRRIDREATVVFPDVPTDGDGGEVPGDDRAPPRDE